MERKYDLIKTIKDDEEVPNFSEASDEEDDFQPRKQKKIENKDFDSNFKFVSDISEYNKDTWNDLSKFIKRKPTNKFDNKINNVLQQRIEEDESDEDNVENTLKCGGKYDFISLSKDELKKDSFKIKEKKGKEKKFIKEENEEKMGFEKYSSTEPYASFYQMNLSRPLLKAITDMNFIHPTPIQASTIPIALMGKDICGCAATGTGKTAAYMLPTLERLLYRPLDGPAISRVLVLVPTRELGVQVYEVTKQLAQFTTIKVGLSVGGLDVKIQETVLRKSPDIVIATPGRLIDHLTNLPTFSLDSIEVLIFDEADRLLHESFADQMEGIIEQCSKMRQTIFFSATMTDEVKDLAAVCLDKPIKIFVDNNQHVAFNLRQEFIRIRIEREGDREAILVALIRRTFHDHVIVFVRTKKQAFRLHILLGLLGVKVGELHGNLTQPYRLENLKKFKNEEIDVLVATDVAARGLDISSVKTVINFAMPNSIQQYIHRVGRTARAGRGGVSVSLAGEQDRHLVKEIIKYARNPVKNRIIPPDIIERYNKKLESIKPDLEKIIAEEESRKKLANDICKANLQNKLSKIANEENHTSCFQRGQERKIEKERLLSSQKKPKSKNNKDKDNPNIVQKRKPQKEIAEDRANKELEKMVAHQARIAKRNNKPKKIRTVVEEDYERALCVKSSKKRTRSAFAVDLTDVGKKGVKRIRYDVNVIQKKSRVKQHTS